MALHGWEVKSMRAGRAQLKEAYVVVENGEIFLIGSHVSPLPSASTHIKRTASVPNSPIDGARVDRSSGSPCCGRAPRA
jgi:hypothetical protein